MLRRLRSRPELFARRERDRGHYELRSVAAFEFSHAQAAPTFGGADHPLRLQGRDAAASGLGGTDTGFLPFPVHKLSGVIMDVDFRTFAQNTMDSQMPSRLQVKVHINRALRAGTVEQKLDEIALAIGELARMTS